MDEPTTRLRDGATQFVRRVDPFLDDHLGVRQGFPISRPVGRTAGEFGHFGDVRPIFLAPIQNDLITNFVDAASPPGPDLPRPPAVLPDG